MNRTLRRRLSCRAGGRLLWGAALLLEHVSPGCNDIADHNRHAVSKRQHDDGKESTYRNNPEPLRFLGRSTTATAEVQDQHDNERRDRAGHECNLVPPLEHPKHTNSLPGMVLGVNPCWQHPTVPQLGVVARECSKGDRSLAEQIRGGFSCGRGALGRPGATRRVLATWRGLPRIRAAARDVALWRGHCQGPSACGCARGCRRWACGGSARPSRRLRIRNCDPNACGLPGRPAIC